MMTTTILPAHLLPVEVQVIMATTTTTQLAHQEADPVRVAVANLEVVVDRAKVAAETVALTLPPAAITQMMSTTGLVEVATLVEDLPVRAVVDLIPVERVARAQEAVQAGIPMITITRRPVRALEERILVAKVQEDPTLVERAVVAPIQAERAPVAVVQAIQMQMTTITQPVAAAAARVVAPMQAERAGMVPTQVERVVAPMQAERAVSDLIQVERAVVVPTQVVVAPMQVARAVAELTQVARAAVVPTQAARVAVVPTQAARAAVVPTQVERVAAPMSVERAVADLTQAERVVAPMQAERALVAA